MTVTRDVNLGTLMPVIMFLLVQTLGGVWWAATLTRDMSSVKEQVALNNSALKERIDEVDAARTEDRRRIYDRIVGVEQVTSQIMASDLANRTLLEGLKDDVTVLRADLQQNNTLIRDLLVRLSTPQRNGALQ